MAPTNDDAPADAETVVCNICHNNVLRKDVDVRPDGSFVCGPCVNARTRVRLPDDAAENGTEAPAEKPTRNVITDTDDPPIRWTTIVGGFVVALLAGAFSESILLGLLAGGAAVAIHWYCMMHLK